MSDTYSNLGKLTAGNWDPPFLTRKIIRTKPQFFGFKMLIIRGVFSATPKGGICDRSLEGILLMVVDFQNVGKYTPETNSLHLKIGHPKRKFHLPSIDFQVLKSWFQGGYTILSPRPRFHRGPGLLIKDCPRLGVACIARHILTSTIHVCTSWGAIWTCQETFP